MAFIHSPRIVTDGLVLALDAANTKSYPGTGTVWKDLSGNGNNGTLINGTPFTTDNLGSLQFDGVDDTVITNFGGGINVFSNPITVTGWIKSETTSGQRMWLDGGGNGTNQRFYAGLVTSTRADYGIQSSLWSSGIPVDIDWHHQAIVMNFGNAIYYDNGIQVHIKQYTSYTLNGNITFGGRVSSFQWLGLISNIKIYNRPLSAEEILQNYNATKGRFGL
jgi:hypothetical protein